MDILVVDDEPLAVQHMKHMLKDMINPNELYTCTNGKEAIDLSLELRPDIVFLDIQMPGMNGLEAADMIKQELPQTMIVFVTAYDQYAIEAFRLNAMDYLLKPIQRERLNITVNRIMEQLKPQAKQDEAKTQIGLHCFQNMRFERENQAIEVKWRTSKVQELLAYLLLHRNKPVDKDHLLEVLWPEFSIEKAKVHLYGVVYHLRKLFADLDLQVSIKNVQNGYRLNLHDTPLDIDIWEDLVQRLPQLDADTVSAYQHCMQLYTGDYLADHDYIWAEVERERIRNIWLNISLQLGDYAMHHEQWNEALHSYQRIIQVVPTHEDVHWNIMKIYLKLNNIVSAKSHYIQYSKLMSKEYGMPPRADIQQWYEDEIKHLCE